MSHTDPGDDTDPVSQPRAGQHKHLQTIQDAAIVSSWPSLGRSAPYTQVFFGRDRSRGRP